MSVDGGKDDVAGGRTVFLLRPDYCAKACLLCFIITIVGGFLVPNDHGLNAVLATFLVATLITAVIFAVWGCVVGFFRWRKLSPDSKRWVLILIVLDLLIFSILIPVL